MSEIDDLTARIRAFADERGWEPFHTPKNLVMALAGEVGELVSEFQWLTPEESAAVTNVGSAAPAWGPQTPEPVLDEIADVAIYLLRLCDVLDVDLGAAIDAKMAKNAMKYPAS